VDHQPSILTNGKQVFQRYLHRNAAGTVCASRRCDPLEGDSYRIRESQRDATKGGRITQNIETMKCFDDADEKYVPHVLFSTNAPRNASIDESRDPASSPSMQNKRGPSVCLIETLSVGFFAANPAITQEAGLSQFIPSLLRAGYRRSPPHPVPDTLHRISSGKSSPCREKKVTGTNPVREPSKNKIR